LTGLLSGLAALTASLPSPGSNEIVLGPLHLRAYGLMIAFGVLAAVEMARRRWAARGGNPDDWAAIAIWAVPAGLIGARLYHVMTDWRTYQGRWLDAFKIWEGGLGIPGGIIAGVAVGVWVGRRRGMRLPTGLDVVAPALPLAQAIGRLGNWWNQEVFGRPTTLPWGLEIAPAHRPARYLDYATFHPTFLYEALWNLVLMGLLIWLDRKRAIRPGDLFVLYVGGYGLGRLWVEALRSDNASLILGLRVNTWMSLLAIGGSVVVLAVRGLRRRPDDDDEPYEDGHRWSPTEGVVEAGVPGPQPAGGGSGDDAADGGSGEAADPR